MKIVAALLVGLLSIGLITGQPAFAASPAASAVPGASYKNFQVAIYITVDDTRRLAKPAVFEREYQRVASQLHFDKVYIETYRGDTFATDAQLEAVKKEFQAKGISTAGGIALVGGEHHNQFVSLDYEKPADRAKRKKAVRLAARHFNEVILDDFFFYNTKSDADIAAKGDKSWTQHRLETMRKVSRELVLGPARAVNPDVRVIIKYPNWYEHFQGAGYDLDKQSHLFDAIYTGAETRDPVLTGQTLQQYQSYEIVRYFDNIRPGKNLGGWVDTYSIRYIDRYAGQLWDTLFAKAPEITLFNWDAMAQAEAATAGTRPWRNQATSFDWKSIAATWRRSHDTPPGWARAAGAALRVVDRVLGQLGHPIGIASYKPYQSSGEDFLHNYLGNIGLPIELSPHFPAQAQTILLTQSAAADPKIVSEMKAALHRGKTVIVTSGLVKSLQNRGFKDIVEWTPTGNIVSIEHYVKGPGGDIIGSSLDEPGHRSPPVLFPEVRFYTNDSWMMVRGVASANHFPLLLLNHYSKGKIYMLTVPENQGDFYNMPQSALTQIKRDVMGDFPVEIDAPVKVALFAYDNNTFVVENYRNEAAKVGISVRGDVSALSAIGGDEQLTPTATGKNARQSDKAVRTRFETTIPAHSFRAYRVEG